MKRFLLPLAVFLIPLSSQLEAQIAPCATNTLASYDAEGCSCILGEGSGGVLEFSQFSFTATANTGSPTLLTDSQIEVTPDPVGQGGGFTFTAPGGPGFTVGAGQTATYDLDYSFVFATDPIASGANIGMDPVTGNVGINERVCADGQEEGCPTFGVSSFNPPSTVCTLPNLTSPCWQNSIPLDVTNNASLENAIVLTGSSGTGAGFDALTDTYDVSSAPEPLTFVLGLGGLVAIGLVRRYRSIR
jgi:hypothetical protein